MISYNIIKFLFIYGIGFLTDAILLTYGGQYGEKEKTEDSAG